MGTIIENAKSLEIFSAAMADILSQKTAYQHSSLYREMLEGSLRDCSRSIRRQCRAIISHADGLKLISAAQRLGPLS